MDKGPWLVAYDLDGKAVAVYSDDFSRDVTLRISGDFADETDRQAYADWLTNALNEASALV